MDKAIEYFLDYCGIAPQSEFGQLITTGTHGIPYIGKIINMVEMHRLKKIEKKHTEQITDIFEVLAQLPQEMNYIIEYSVPFFLRKIEEAEQEEKIRYILNAFEQVAQTKYTNMDDIIEYHQTLSSLNNRQIDRLVQGYGNNQKVYLLNDDFQHSLSDHILETQFLIQSFDFNSSAPLVPTFSEDAHKGPYKQLTSYGERFLDYFRVKQSQIISS